MNKELRLLVEIFEQKFFSKNEKGALLLMLKGILLNTLHNYEGAI
jgi:hypothetical protein